MTTATLTARERYLGALSCGPLLEGDAIVMLCGEDTDSRIPTAVGLFMQRCAKTLVLSGGLDSLPRIKSAQAVFPLLLGKGIAPDRIVCEDRSLNTREQAVNIVELALEKGWHRLLIVASPYHCPRAHLTFLRALDEAKQADHIHVLMIPCSHSQWFQSPTGVPQSRIELFEGELRKIDEYGAKGDVATYERGLEYLERWENR